MLKIAFICNTNSCRTQMAEAIVGIVGSGEVVGYSAGTVASNKLNTDAIQIIEELYGVDIKSKQHPKLIEELPDDLDIVVTMGCNILCPNVKARYRESWGIVDPTGKGKDAFVLVAKHIEKSVKELLESVDYVGFKSNNSNNDQTM